MSRQRPCAEPVVSAALHYVIENTAVTGSNIKRVDVEGPSPILVLVGPQDIVNVASAVTQNP